MSRTWRMACLMAALLLTWFSICGFRKAVTYAGREWVVNFWGTEMNTLDADFRQIREDGFNSVVIPVPWRQFQPDTGKREKNQEAYDRLSRIFEAAKRQGLGVILRVSYTWDCYPGGGSLKERFYGLRSDASLREAWLQYVGDLYREASGHTNFAGGFLTWEDFWNFVEESGTYGQQSARIAKESGYAAWARAHYDSETLSRYYGRRISEVEMLDFPDRNAPAQRFVFEWNDAWMNQLLADAQKVFPDLSLEVRLDLDPVSEADGTRKGYLHAETFLAGNASYTSCMFSAPMGYDPGTEITADMGIQKAGEILGNLRRLAGGKPIFVDQFLYDDNTPEFAHNARIIERELPSYITGMASVLTAAGGGYAVWAYRDYKDNAIYNGQFGLGDEGWKLTGGAEVENAENNAFLFLPAGGRAMQNLSGRTTKGEKTWISFHYRAEEPCSLRIEAGNDAKTVALKGEGDLTLESGLSQVPSLSFRALGAAVELDEVQVYGFVTEGGIYRCDGSEGPYLQAIRELNRRLSD